MFPANEYEFSVRRDSLKEAERLFEGKITSLTEVNRCYSSIREWLSEYYFAKIQEHFLSRKTMSHNSFFFWKFRDDLILSKFIKSVGTFTRKNSVS